MIQNILHNNNKNTHWILGIKSNKLYNKLLIIYTMTENIIPLKQIMST